jgi:uncharacterized repeat protein (TIGR02543 family)
VGEKHVWINNISATSATDLIVNPLTNFTITGAQSTIAAGNAASITVKPKTTLTAGTYTEDLVVYNGGTFVSVALTFTVIDAETPGAPKLTDDWGVSVVSEPLTLYWGAPDDDGGSPITGYAVTVKDYPGYTQSGTDINGDEIPGWLVPKYIPQTGNSFNFAPTEIGIYQIGIRAVNARGMGDAVWYRWQVRESDVGVLDVRQIQANQQLEYMWMAPEGETPAGYEASIDGGEWERNCFTAGSWYKYVFTGLKNGQSYNVSLRPYYGDGSTGPETNIVGTPTASKTPSVKNLKAEPRDGKVILTWDAPDDGYYGYYVSTNGVVYYSVGGNTFSWTMETEGNGYNGTPLVNGTTYVFEVVASLNSNTTQATSAFVTATPQAGLPDVPSVPQKVTVTQNNDGEIRITWDAPASDGGMEVLYYEIGYAPEELGEYIWQNTDSFGEYIFYTIPANYDGQFSFWLRAVNAVGAGSTGSGSFSAVYQELRGNKSVTLPTGYTATDAGEYRIFSMGNSPADRTEDYDWTIKSGGEGKVTWNDTSKKVEIAAGLSAGVYDVILQANDKYYVYDYRFYEFHITLTVYDGGLGVTTASLPDGVTGQAYNSVPLAASVNGAAWSVTAGALPTGLSLSEAGSITGVPTAEGTFNFTVKAQIGEGFVEKQLSIIVNPPTTPDTVTSVTVSPATVAVEKGTTQQFDATVAGTNNPAQTVTWTVEGGTGTTDISTSGLLTVNASETATTLTVRATSTVDDTKSGTATVTVTTAPPVHIPVTNITGVPTTATVGTPITLTGTVTPNDATNKNIVWSGTGVSGDQFTPTSAGTATVTATITDGTAVGTDYTQNFNITVSAAPPAFVPVTNITGVPTTATVGTPITLSGTVTPGNATNKNIVWSGTGVSGNQFTPASEGTATVTATIINGLTASSNYTQNFDITVSAAPLPALSGTASISGTSEIGQTLTVVTSSVTGGSGAFSYQWKSDGTNTGSDAATYELQGSDVGKAITCVITRADATGSVTATFDSGAVVPYDITITNIGNDAGDTAVTLTATTGRVSDSITLNYVLGNGSSDTTNTLTFSGGTGLVNLATAGANTTQNYTVNAGDANANGVIAITATFTHSSLATRTLTFADGNQTKTFGDSVFTKTATASPSDGTNSVVYSSNDTSVADVDSASGEVTVGDAGTATITATIAEDTYIAATATYIVTVNNASQSVPSGVGKTDETTAGANDGTITGVTTAMEYKLSTAGSYTAVTGTTVTGLAPGTYNVRYAEKANYDAGTDATVTIAAGASAYIAVTNITGVPTTATVGTTLALTGTVTPGTATNQTIVWSISDTGTTGASISGNILNTTAAGAVTVRATITNGATASSNYTQDFPITVNPTAATTYTVTFNANGGSVSETTRTITQGAVIGTLPTPTRSSYSFDGWFMAASGGSAISAATIPTGNTTYYAHWTSSGGGSGGGTPPSGGGTTTPTNPPDTTTPPAEQTVPAADGKASVGYTTSGDTATVKLPDAKVEELITKSDENVEIDLSGVSGAKSAVIPESASADFAAADKGLTVVLPVASISFDNSALETINAAGSGDITISAEKVSKSSLPEAVRGLVPDDAVIVDFTVKNGSVTVSDFNGGIATVSIPYSLPSGVRTAQIVIYYMNDSRNLELVIGKSNPETKTVDITLSHFSKYVIKINDVKYTVGKGWYNADSLDFAVQRGLVSVTNGIVEPTAETSRVDFVISALKALGIQTLKTFKVEQFSDIGHLTAIQQAYLRTARELGVIDGVGDNRFDPDSPALREHFFQIVNNIYAAKLTAIPKVVNSKTIADFTDGESVPTWAVAATNELIRRGVIQGDGSKLQIGAAFNNATTAELLMRLNGVLPTLPDEAHQIKEPLLALEPKKQYGETDEDSADDNA